MKKYFRIIIFFTMHVLLLSSSVTLASSRDEQAATISVHAHMIGGESAYTYTIENTGTKPILGFSVGFDHYTGASELSGEHPIDLIVPNAWASRIITLAESPYYEIRWEPTFGTPPLTPGGIVTGFTVITKNPNNMLLSAHWTVIIDGPPTYASSLLKVVSEPPFDIDIVPPNISVELAPSIIWPPNNKMVDIEATLTVSDNSDPAPMVTLGSVSCNECDTSIDVTNAEIGADDYYFSVRASRTGQAKPGRVYTITYSATDLAGNKANASSTITVPHDQRKE